MASLKEQLKNAIEAGQAPRQMEEERHSVEAEAHEDEIPSSLTISVPVVDVETYTALFDFDTKKSVMMNILSHRISFLKRISQDAYSLFINFQSLE